MKTGYDQFFKKAQATSKKAAAARAKTSHTQVGSKANSKFKFKESLTEDSNKSSIPLNTQQLTEKLRKQMVPKRRAARTLPWKLISSSMIGFAMASFGLLNLEKVEHYFKHIEISVLGEAYAQDPKKDEKPKGATEVASGTDAEKKEEPKPENRKDFTPEEVNHFAKLNERKRELDARETELGQMEAELAVQKVELEKRIQELEATRKSISQVLEQKVEADEKKLGTLVEMYSNMKPQQAAKIFETMDEDLAVEILGRMKKKNAAEVMNLVKPEKAQIFSEKYAGYKRK
jgi:flagellar motility protein MotE (MotC chaperone)